MNKQDDLKRLFWGYLEYVLIILLSLVFNWIYSIGTGQIWVLILNLLLIAIVVIINKWAFIRKTEASLYMMVVWMRCLLIILILLLFQYIFPAPASLIWFLLSLGLVIFETLIVLWFEAKKILNTIVIWEKIGKINLEKGHFSILRSFYQYNAKDRDLFKMAGIIVPLFSFVLLALLRAFTISFEDLIIRLVVLGMVFIFTVVFSKMFSFWLILLHIAKKKGIAFKTEYARLEPIQQEPQRKMLKRHRGKKK